MLPPPPFPLPPVPITTIQPPDRNPDLNGFISCGFDGKLTVWDSRRHLTPLRSWAVQASADDRLARAAMLGPDICIAGGMDGKVHCWDFNWLRGL